MNKQARRAALRAHVTAAERRIRALHAMRDWLGLPQAIADYWTAANAWRSL